MSRTVITVCVGVSVCALGAGCSNFFEARAISQFTTALEEKKLSELKVRTSEQFQQRALRHAEALHDFEILRIPDGKMSIVSVKEGDSKDEKKITVEVGESKKKLLYKLVNDKKTGNLVVDDIWVRQKKHGLKSGRWVSEQMDLLLTVREFLDTWDEGTREKVLAISTPELQAVLSELPPDYLHRLTGQVIGKRSKSKKLRPKAELDGKDAIVTLPRTTGKMILSFKLDGEKWKVSDIAVQAKASGQDKIIEIPSVLKTATALNASLQFLKSYESGDKQSLAKLCTQRLWNESLKHASRNDLTSIRLTPEGSKILDYELQMRAHRGNFIVRGKTEWLRIALIKDTETKELGGTTRYLIEDVTIYGLKDKQEVRLSSKFMAKEILRIFAKALAEQRRDVIRQIATVEFNRRVWEQADVPFMRSALPRDLLTTSPQIIETKYLGPVTRIETRHGRRKVTYVLRDRGGQVRVDDILMPQIDLPDSLRERLELQLPIYRFAAALQANNIQELQRNSSTDFSRLTWKMTKRVPPAGAIAPRHLSTPLRKVTKVGDKTIVELGGQRFGAKVLLTEEHTRPVIDDVLMIAGLEPSKRAKLKLLMREQLAGGQRTQPVVTQALSGTADRLANGARPSIPHVGRNVVRPVPRKLTMQLTPLLDLLLIVIFAQYMEMRDESNASSAREREQVATLESERDRLARLQNQIDRKAQQDRDRITKLRDQLRARSKQDDARVNKLTAQRDLLSKHLAALFQVPESTLKKTLEPLAAADVARTAAELKRLENKVKSLAAGGTPRVVRHVIKYEELLKRCDIWEIHVNAQNLARVVFGSRSHEFRYSAKLPQLVDGNDPQSKQRNKAEIVRYRKELQDDFERKLFAYYKNLPQLKNVVIILLSRERDTPLATYDAAKLGLQQAADHISTDTGARITVVSTDLGQLKYEPAESR
eukprot:g8419.t1